MGGLSASALLKQESYLVIDHVSKYFIQKKQRLNVLEDINFSMDKGEILCIVGASGCGKSTLLRAISGLDSDHGGQILIGGKEVVAPSKSRGIVFQEHRLFSMADGGTECGICFNGYSKGR